MCGENETTVCFAVVHRGSSPRVRGKPCDAAPARRDLGLIPACAGKTLSPDTPDSMVAAHPRVCGENPPGSRVSRSRGGAHPRVCGENLLSAGRSLIQGGSSPRVRGKQVRVAAPVEGERLIPACAGKTCVGERSQTHSAAHPRVCGENFPRGRSFGLGAGSSPRVRGKPGGGAWPPGRWRLIPACAGKTFSAR